MKAQYLTIAFLIILLVLCMAFYMIYDFMNLQNKRFEDLNFKRRAEESQKLLT